MAREDMMRINVTISEKMNDDLQIICSRWGCSKSDLIAIIVGQYLDNFDAKNFVHGFDILNERYRAYYLKKQKHKGFKKTKEEEALELETIQLHQELLDELDALDEL